MLEQIKEAIMPLIMSHDCYLDDIEYVKEKNEWYLRIFIEKNEGYLDMDTCVAVSEAISEKLDEIDVIPQEYYLEVSSPGIEKPLKTLEKVADNVGEYIHIDFKNPTQGMNDLEGTLLSVDGTTLKVQYMVKAVKKVCTFDYSQVKFIRLAVKF